MATEKLSLRDPLDNELFNHISYVVSKSLLIIKNEGVDKATLVTIGKLLFRLYNVIGAYNAKRRKLTLDELIALIGDFRNAFGQA